MDRDQAEPGAAGPYAAGPDAAGPGPMAQAAEPVATRRAAMTAAMTAADRAADARWFDGLRSASPTLGRREA